jgi:hypothetical protein
MTKRIEELHIFHSALEQYHVETTIGGEEVVKRDTLIEIGGESKRVNMPSLEAKMATNMIKVVDIMEMLSKSVTENDIKKMGAKDAISSLAKLMSATAQYRGKKVGNTHFTQINLSGSTKDVEKQMLEYTKMKQ